MMTLKQLLFQQCHTLPFVYEDYPFDDKWAVFRHKANRKSFALFFEREGHTWVNVKAEPLQGDFYRQLYSAVVPAYHMNKQHWISIILDGSMTQAEVFSLIENSFRLTQPRQRKRSGGSATRKDVQHEI